jgi:hypothetical protein
MNDKNRLVAHCGGKVVTLDDLAAYELPEATSSYVPIPHKDLADFVKQTAGELLRQPVCRESYAVTKDGQRMFGMQVFGEDSSKCQVCKATGSLNGEPCPSCNGSGWAENEYGFGVGFRNSYDKSMSVGIAAGFNVFVCDNLCISGEIKILRKHTKGVWSNIDQVLVHTLFRKGPEIRAGFDQDVNQFKNRELSVHDGYAMLGVLMGNQVLMPTQVSVALNEWNHRTNFNQQNDSAWGLYNSCTYALKSTPPHKILERHRALHELIKMEV